jgi:sugar phosphate isomerase/epimerase
VVDDARRRRTLAEAEAALAMARVLPYRHLVVHLGVPDGANPDPSDNSGEASRRSVEALQEMAERAGVRLALEVIPNALSRPERLVALIEHELEAPGIGICLDVGHAFLLGDVADAIETCSGHIVTTHLHDNHGKRDDHLAPGDGGIDWAAALMSLQKVGYDGTWLFEVANTASPAAVLDKVARACRRFEQWLAVPFDLPSASEDHPTP